MASESRPWSCVASSRTMLHDAIRHRVHPRRRTPDGQARSPDAGTLLNAIDELGQEPRPKGCRKLTGEEAWRVRIGSFRVIYEIADARLTVTVVRAGHRRDVYRR
ncbi:type II toxin-antitoxin system RelE/ParE family toxin [Kineosphaera limosa]